MEYLRAKREVVVDFGPALMQRGECLVENMRTSIRSQGARKAIATHQWANTIDMILYLEGFDQGEQYARNISDTQEHSVPEKVLS
jgi:hypothetical protein